MPKISVIISTYNRARSISRCFESLLAQTFSDYEILLIDNNAKNITPDIFKSLIPHSNVRLRYYLEPVQGKCRALNMGIKYAQGEIIAFTDDDVIVDPHWLTAILKCFEEFQCDAVGGRVVPIYPYNTPQWVKDHPHQMAGTVVIYDQGEKTRIADPSMERFIGCNWAFKRSVFTECGVFRTDLGPGTLLMGEDEEFYFRLLHKNKKLYYCPQAIISHPVDLKRLSLKHIAAWHIALGHFEAKKEYETKRNNMVFIAGIPRYIFKGIISNFILMSFNILNRFRFHYHFRAFFRKLGMIDEYRNIHRV